MAILFWEQTPGLNGEDAQQVAQAVQCEELTDLYIADGSRHQPEEFAKTDTTNIYVFARQHPEETIVRLREGAEPLAPGMVSKMLDNHEESLSPYTYCDGRDLDRNFILEIVDPHAFSLAHQRKFYPDGSLALFHLEGAVAHIPDFDDYAFYYRDNYDRFYGPYPSTLNIEPSVLCNLNCIMCDFRYDYNKFAKKPGYPKNMPEKLAKKILDEAAAHKPKSICCGYRGEPLMNRDLHKLFEYSNAQGVPLTLVSNGMLMDEETSRSYLDAKIAGLVFSLDGTTKDTYESIRVGAEFETVTENIRRFAKLAGERSPRPTFGIRMVKQRENWHEEMDLVREWLDVVDFVVTSLPFSFYKDGKRFARYKGSNNRVYAGRRPCRELWMTTCITTTGLLLGGCPFNAAEQEGLRFGNLNESTLEELWNNEIFTDKREKMLAGRFDELPMCKDCEGINAAMHTLGKDIIEDKYYRIQTAAYNMFWKVDDNRLWSESEFYQRLARELA